MKKIYFSASLLCASLGVSHAQVTEVYFKYDEAGSQRYRGPENDPKQKARTLQAVSRTAPSTQPVITMDKQTFWKQIRLYPVPVNDALTIDWTEETDKLIESISLYQHSTVHWKFQQQNIPGLNRHLKINMTGFDWGVYVLHFTLKDGRIFSKNITKR